MDNEYYHFVSEPFGDRYFKVNWINGTCTQVILSQGAKKKGRPHMLGIYHLAISSFRGTYHWYFNKKNLSGATRMVLTTQNQYDKAVEKTLKKL